MTTLPRPYWHEMQAPDFLGGEKDWIAVLPVCAIEQHGPHLPVYTDACIGEGMVKRTVELLPEGLPATFLPIQPVGKSNEHIASPGTLTYSWETAIRIWMEIGDSVARAGVRKMVLVTSHGGNVPVCDIIARELRIRHGMLCVSTGWAGAGEPAGLVPPEEDLYGIHGGDVETALMLHFRPDLVDMSRTERFEPLMLPMAGERYRWLRPTGPHAFAWMAQDVHPAGVAGDASLATAEKGKATAALQAQGFAELMADVARFPLAKLHKAD